MDLEEATTCRGGCIILTYAALVVGPLLDLPTAMVCERGRTDVEATPTIAGGRFAFAVILGGPTGLS